MGEMGKDWLLLGGVSASGAFRLYSREQRFKLESGWTVLHFAAAPPVERKGGAAPAAGAAGQDPVKRVLPPACAARAAPGAMAVSRSGRRCSAR